ncbi:MAG: 30S ribosomal protein S9 [Patescibacteria group bacterium]|jgi:small subunit ribosomal protein S9
MTAAKSIKESIAPAKRSRRGYVYAVGRRKSAVARVRIYEKEPAEIIVNNKPLAEYFPFERYQQIVLGSLEAMGGHKKGKITVRVVGGGVRGQAECIRHGIARALIGVDPEARPTLKKVGYLTRDARVKERKKYGLKRARRAPQWQKR